MSSIRESAPSAHANNPFRPPPCSLRSPAAICCNALQRRPRVRLREQSSHQHTEAVSSPLRATLLLMSPLPALVMGVVVMRRSGVNPGIPAQQLAVGLLLTIACVFACLRRRPSVNVTPPASIIIAAVAAVVLLALTLLHHGLDGVHRWVSVGSLQLHAGFVALPVLIMLAGALGRRGGSRARWVVDAGLVLAAVILACQPDASQAAAFAGAVATVVLQRNVASRIDWIAVAVCVGASLVAVSRRGALEPVPHVEGIVRLAANSGLTWLVASIAALMLLPIPFVVNWVRHRDHHESMGLAVYFVTVCIAALVAPFPVPVLGFGLSPLLGYFIALGWTVRSDAVSTLSPSGESEGGMRGV